MNWDDPLPDEIIARWERWRTELPLLEKSNSTAVLNRLASEVQSKLKYTVFRMQANQELVKSHIFEQSTLKEKFM